MFNTNDLKNIFELYDKDFDGFIHKKDVVEIMVIMNIENIFGREIYDLQLKLIIDDSKIDYDLFTKIMSFPDFNDKGFVNRCFNDYSENNDNKIKIANFIRLMTENNYDNDDMSGDTDNNSNNLFQNDDLDEILKEICFSENGNYIDYNMI